MRFSVLFNVLYFEIRKSVIYKILTETKYTNPDGLEVLVQQQDNNSVGQGDYVFMFGEQVENAVINFSKTKNLVVKDGVVIGLEWKNRMLQRIEKNGCLLGFIVTAFVVSLLIIIISLTM